MTRKHYHVGENTPGYLPEGDVSTHRTKGDAENAAQWLADQYRDDWDASYRVTGNKQEGYEIEDLNKTHDLGRVIWIAPCQDDCELELD